MTRRVIGLLFVSLFVLVAVNAVSAQQQPAQAAPTAEATMVAPATVAPCDDCVTTSYCCAPSPCCDPCCPPVIGYRRGFLGICRPVYAAPCCDPCGYPAYPRYYRGWYRGYGW